MQVVMPTAFMARERQSFIFEPVEDDLDTNCAEPLNVEIDEERSVPLKDFAT
jgi:hypothetical protein